jgi:hypothetical protein
VPKSGSATERQRSFLVRDQNGEALAKVNYDDEAGAAISANTMKSWS